MLYPKRSCLKKIFRTITITKVFVEAVWHLLRFNKYFLDWHSTNIKLTQGCVTAIPSLHIHLAIWRSDLQADIIHPRCFCGLLCAQPHCFEYGEVLCHCVSTAVTKSVHRISGQVCCGFDLVTCPHTSPAQMLDTGEDQISGIHDLSFSSRFTKRLATHLMGFTFCAFPTWMIGSTGRCSSCTCWSSSW